MAKKGLLHTVSSEVFQKVFSESSSVHDALQRLGYTSVSSSYRSFYRRCCAEGLDVGELGQRAKDERARKNRERGQRVAFPLSSVLVINSTYNRGRLKQRLVSGGMLQEHCSNCGLAPEWDGKPLMLVLDHINGVRDDNRIENLRLLCPNCNSQTDTFSGRNGNNKRCQNLCGNCGAFINRQSKRCRRCSSVTKGGSRRITRKVPVENRPSIEEIRQLKQTMSWGDIGKMYGVSDNAVKKWIRAAGGDLSTFPDNRKR